MTRILVTIIKAYRLVLSPLLGPRCRFLPTCSEYAQQAVLTHGCWRGSLMALRRLSRCHPLSAGGLDPVPECRVHRDSN